MSHSISDILQSLRAERAPNDRRRSPRVGLRTRVSVCARDSAHPQLGWMRDLSEGGAGLLVARELRPDQPIILRVAGSDKHITSIRCRVVHCAPAGSSYRVGVEFLHKPWQVDPQDAEGDEFEALKQYLRRLSTAVME